MALAFPFFSFRPRFFVFPAIMNNDRRSIDSESESKRERERLDDRFFGR